MKDVFSFCSVLTNWKFWVSDYLMMEVQNICFLIPIQNWVEVRVQGYIFTKIDKMAIISL